MIKLGIIGTGLMAGIMAGVCQESGFTAHSILSRKKETARQFGKVHHIDNNKLYTDAIPFFSDPELQAVYIATPTSEKMHYIELCLRFAKPVLIEKPLPSCSIFSSFVTRAKEENLVWMDATHFIHNECYAMLREMMDTCVGNLVRIDASFFWPDQNNGQIKFSPDLEPDGALGDIGWYPLRLLSTLVPDSLISHASGFMIQNNCNAIIEFNTTGFTHCGISFSLASSYRGTVVRQQCIISGDKGELTLRDFVMPYCGSFVYGKILPSTVIRHSWGLKPLVDYEDIMVSFSRLQHTAMLKNFHNHINRYDLDKLYQHQVQALSCAKMMVKIKEILTPFVVS
ncbi:Gfo/Idh/MocA family oxidoreductase [Xenorhabdus sp. XENO-10]|uniref:Gfo/Idh/MocA family oxidoreductase n=1 Tax=Xenorhabdus yunnanensis TaxID=3025878 RepID=A0ABT5LFT6_9GAMM|nr:Gfo/Idh/MocA family oxidoreductase [Xenorhabdus yunnanensis]MDC9589967.1 Gfo/Idh/MocA family oxidoreductase [Xenorhabdus yunnanensis]